MKICSWDVGVKNLSYCILSQNNGSYSICDWDNLNVIDDMPVSTCSQLAKNNKPCKSRAKFVGTVNGTQMVFCAKHSKVYPSLVKDRLEQIESCFDNPCPLDKRCCYVLKQKQVPCGKKAHCVSNNGEYLCNVHRKLRIKQQQKDLQLTEIKRVNANKFPIDQLKIKLFKLLDSKPQLLQVDQMIIENQPTFKNPRMKSISNALFDYFVLRGIVDKMKTNSIITKVKFICPSNKLKVDENNTLRTLSKTDDGEKYKMTKALAVQYCKQMIANDKKNLEFLLAAPKKDDLSDCYLQGVHYLNQLD